MSSDRNGSVARCLAPILLTLVIGCAEPGPSARLDAQAAGDAGADAGAVELDAGDAGSALALRVLFVGNSYTFVNDLPSLVRTALGSAPEVASIEVESVTEGGVHLYDHWGNGVAMERLRTGGFTHVVLQGQSAEPCATPVAFHDSALSFARLAREVGTTAVFFETWAHRADSGIYVEGGHPFGTTPMEMQACLNAGYEAAAAEGMAELARVGDAWALALATSPDLALFGSDGAHPSLAGSWLAAAVFVRVIADRSARGLASPAGLPIADAELLAGVADAL